MRRTLLVKPAPSPDALGGDTVVYRRLGDYVAARSECDVLELAPISRAAQLVNVAQGLPPETARYLGAGNRAALRARLAQTSYDAVLFAHEAMFPLSDDAALGEARKVLFAHNVPSLIAATDQSPTARLMRRQAQKFERRWLGDRSARVVCISRADVEGLRTAGVRRDDVLVAPPGAPPEAVLAEGAAVLAEAVLTGSYGWWRKRRDLKAFAAEPPLPYPIRVSDPAAREILAGETLLDAEGLDWSAGVRFGLITDRFQGGFKLKSLEYVANNCLILSLCDLGREFEGLPHAEEFIRFVGSKREMAEAIAAETSANPGVVERFRVFKAACLERYAWERCLAPIGEALGV